MDADRLDPSARRSPPPRRKPTASPDSAESCRHIALNDITPTKHDGDSPSDANTQADAAPPSQRSSAMHAMTPPGPVGRTPSPSKFSAHHSLTVGTNEVVGNMPRTETRDRLPSPQRPTCTTTTPPLSQTKAKKLHPATHASPHTDLTDSVLLGSTNSLTTCLFNPPFTESPPQRGLTPPPAPSRLAGKVSPKRSYLAIKPRQRTATGSIESTIPFPPSEHIAAVGGRGIAGIDSSDLPLVPPLLSQPGPYFSTSQQTTAPIGTPYSPSYHLDQECIGDPTQRPAADPASPQCVTQILGVSPSAVNFALKQGQGVNVPMQRIVCTRTSNPGEIICSSAIVPASSSTPIRLDVSAVVRLGSLTPPCTALICSAATSDESSYLVSAVSPAMRSHFPSFERSSNMLTASAVSDAVRMASPPFSTDSRNSPLQSTPPSCSNGTSFAAPIRSDSVTLLSDRNTDRGQRKGRTPIEPLVSIPDDCVLGELSTPLSVTSSSAASAMQAGKYITQQPQFLTKSTEPASVLQLANNRIRILGTSSGTSVLLASPTDSQLWQDNQGAVQDPSRQSSATSVRQSATASPLKPENSSAESAQQVRAYPTAAWVKPKTPKHDSKLRNESPVSNAPHEFHTSQRLPSKEILGNMGAAQGVAELETLNTGVNAPNQTAHKKAIFDSADWLPTDLQADSSSTASTHSPVQVLQHQIHITTETCAQHGNTAEGTKQFHINTAGSAAFVPTWLQRMLEFQHGDNTGGPSALPEDPARGDDSDGAGVMPANRSRRCRNSRSSKLTFWVLPGITFEGGDHVQPRSWFCCFP